MEVLSFIVLILLSLVGYSGGAAGKAGKLVDLKPQLTDLVIVIFIWGGAIYSRIVFDLNKLLIILIWVILSSIIGMLTVWARNLSKEKPQKSKKFNKLSSNLFKKLWQSWKDFSKRIGSFQSRIILSLFFFIFILPFAIALKMISDPLRIKQQSSKSYWLTKKETKIDMEQYKKQF